MTMQKKFGYGNHIIYVNNTRYAQSDDSDSNGSDKDKKAQDEDEMTDNDETKTDDKKLE